MTFKAKGRTSLFQRECHMIQELVDRRWWTEGSAGLDDQGQVCTMGAVRASDTNFLSSPQDVSPTARSAISLKSSLTSLGSGTGLSAEQDHYPRCSIPSQPSSLCQTNTENMTPVSTLFHLFGQSHFCDWNMPRPYWPV